MVLLLIIACARICMKFDATLRLGYFMLGNGNGMLGNGLILQHHAIDHHFFQYHICNKYYITSLKLLTDKSVQITPIVQCIT